MLPWHQNDDFWKAFAPFLFSSEHWIAAKAEVENVITLLDLKATMQILDLCCGPGRHTLELARRGFQVTGVDRNSQYLKKAKRLAKREKYSCQFHSADMRDFRRPQTYDVVLNLYTSLGYFEDPEDDKRVLRNAYDSLKPGGRMLIDTVGREVVARHFRERDWQEKNGVFFLQENRLNEDWSGSANRWIRIDNHQRQEFTFSLRLFSGAELRQWLLETGFQSVNLYGDLTGEPYNHNAKRLVALAQK